MAQLMAYLNFRGRCQEALDFYQKCFDGKTVSIYHFTDVPKEMSEKIAPEWQNKIMHAEFKAGDIHFFASDGMNELKSPLDPNANSSISLSLNFTDGQLQNQCFEKLAGGGKITMPLQDTFWGAKFGTLVDRFGITWMLSLDTRKPQG